ncbi:hypothetical protein T12_14934 [Trichinella patagoniensis]|uniref:Uncharacterized protein n=1 Tax=Trichinella patagoniensis TaxID=990121 RepID=A0A0V0Z5X3_9BILA|nr:hypothetical protein T12_14934 [Trichinella patagoniensis]
MPQEKIKAAVQSVGRCFHFQKHVHIRRNCPDQVGHPAASSTSTFSVRNSDISVQKAGRESKTMEPRKAQVNIATTE